MRLSEKQVASVIALPAKTRYSHFLKQVTDREIVWGLYDDGWAIASDSSSNKSLPIWCACEYAELLINGDWSNYKPHSCDLKAFLREMLPDLARNSISVAVMYSPEDNGIVVPAERLLSDIEVELLNY